MLRRVCLARICIGRLALPPQQAHHLRQVLRLEEDTIIEVFDSAGRSARGALVFEGPTGASVAVEQVTSETPPAMRWIVASAVPKGPRADWMIEKLSELGTSLFIPLSTERSVVHPEGQGKRQRWARLAAESAQQSRRAGVMDIAELTPLPHLLNELRRSQTEGSEATATLFFSTAADAVPMPRCLEHCEAGSLYLLIGPEGGWSAHEIQLMRQNGLTAASLGRTILRVETAAVAAAAITAALATPPADLRTEEPSP